MYGCFLRHNFLKKVFPPLPRAWRCWKVAGNMTQLSQKGISTFTKGLKMLKSRWKYAVAGSPCTAYRHRYTLRSYVLVNLPSQGTTSWLCVWGVWICQDPGCWTCGCWHVGYGWPVVWTSLQCSSQECKVPDGCSLSELVDRVACQSMGPRAIGGDFNYGPTELEQFDRLRALGFQEVQDLCAWRFGTSSEATGRGSRRLDQLWISPELQRAYLSTTVDFACWADHAAVSASFSHECLSVTITSWPCPVQFPWPQEWTCPVAVDYFGDLSVEYAKFWMQVETQARVWSQHQGVPVTKAHCGRASVLEPKPVRQYLCPLKKARKGDVQPTFMGVSLQHARYFRQLRRLQSLTRILSKGTTTWNGCLNRDETWRAIRMAVGFPGGFGPWWDSNGLQPSLGAPLSLCCPSLEFVQTLFQGFQHFMQKYETSLTSQRYQFAKHRRAQKLSYVFQDCKDDPLPKADVLLDSLHVGVEEVRHEDNSMVLVRPVQLLDDLPVVVDGHVVQVVAHCDDQVWVDSLPDVSPGCWLTQERAVLSDAAILARFEEVWGARWT